MRDNIENLIKKIYDLKKFACELDNLIELTFFGFDFDYIEDKLYGLISDHYDIEDCIQCLEVMINVIDKNEMDKEN